MGSKSPTSTPKKPFPTTPTSPIFNFFTPLSSRHHPTSYYTPLSQSEETSTIPIYVGSQLTYTPVSNQNIRASHHATNEGQIRHSHLDLLVAQRSSSRLRWLAALAGAMLMAMLLCGNRLGSTQQFVLPLGSITRHPTDPNSSFTNTSSTSWHPTLSGKQLGDDEERYLFPIHIGEQETKASSHLLQLGLLAQSLNRTLILPRVGSGYISQCGAHPFETYYASHALARWNIRAISQTEVEGRIASPVRAQLVAFSRKSASRSPTFSNISAAESHLAETRCISAEMQRNLVISPTLLQISGATGWHHSETSRSVFRNSLVDNLAAQDHVSFLLADWKLLYPLFNPIPTYYHLEYNHLLDSLANKLVDLLGGPSNIIAIHWRQETVPLPVIERCTQVFEGTLPLGEEEWLWIASDYPFENLLDPHAREDAVPRAHSGTFHTLTASHHLSMSNMVANLQQKARTTHQRKLITLHTLLNANELDEPLVKSFLGRFGQDRGVLGIVEKLVLTRINRILVGSDNGDRGRCSKSSSYSRQIVKMHEEFEAKDGEGRRKREVAFWG